MAGDRSPMWPLSRMWAARTSIFITLQWPLCHPSTQVTARSDPGLTQASSAHPPVTAHLAGQPMPILLPPKPLRAPFTSDAPSPCALAPGSPLCPGALLSLPSIPLATQPLQHLGLQELKTVHTRPLEPTNTDPQGAAQVRGRKDRPTAGKQVREPRAGAVSEQTIGVLCRTLAAWTSPQRPGGPDTHMRMHRGCND